LAEKVLSIVIPVYNEEACVEAVVKEWIQVTDRIPNSVLLVIDDGSVDQTGTILDKLSGLNPALRVTHQKNQGHGGAVLRGYKEAIKSSAEWIFQIDGDQQFESSDFWKLWERRPESPFILGWRPRRKDPRYRIYISKLMRMLLFVFFCVSFKDPNCPFRLIKSDFLSSLLPEIGSNVFIPNICLSILAVKRGARTLDIPVKHLARETGTASLKPLAWGRLAIRCLKDLIFLRMGKK